MNETEVENKGLDERFFQILLTRLKEIPASQTMGIRVLYLGPGQVGLKMIARREYTTVWGRLHGGTVTTLADTAMGFAVASLGHKNVTVDLNINFITPVFEENELTAEGCVIHAGKTSIIAEASLFTNNGNLVAKSRGTFFVLP